MLLSVYPTELKVLSISVIYVLFEFCSAYFFLVKSCPEFHETLFYLSKLWFMRSITGSNKTAAGNFLPGRFLANSPSTSMGLRGLKWPDLYRSGSTEYIIYHFDLISLDT